MNQFILSYDAKNTAKDKNIDAKILKALTKYLIKFGIRQKKPIRDFKRGVASTIIFQTDISFEELSNNIIEKFSKLIYYYFGEIKQTQKFHLKRNPKSKHQLEFDIILSEVEMEIEKEKKSKLKHYLNVGN